MNTSVLFFTVLIINSALALSQWQQEMLRFTNAARTRFGLQPLCMNNKLNDAANAHAADLQRSRTFSHTGSDGSTLSIRLDRVGFRLQSAGENLASPSSASLAFDGLMNSPSHRANILKPEFRFLGVGGIEQNGQNIGNWVQVFGSSTVETCSGDALVDANSLSASSGRNAQASPIGTQTVTSQPSAKSGNVQTFTIPLSSLGLTESNIRISETTPQLAKPATHEERISAVANLIASLLVDS